MAKSEGVSKHLMTTRRAWVMVGWGLVIVAADQFSRWLVVRYMDHGPTTDSHTLLHFEIRVDYGNLVNNNLVPGAVLLIMHILLFTAILGMGLAMSGRAAHLGAGIALGGMVSNWLSLTLGSHHIVDFISVAGGWKVINVADIAVLVGVMMIVSRLPAYLTTHQYRRAGLRSEEVPEKV